MAKKDKRSGVYCICNKINRKCYVGSSINISSRLSRHKWELTHNKHSNQYLQNDFNKFGLDSFVFLTLEISKPESRISREQQWLDAIYDNQQQCYNINPHAESPKGRKYTREQHVKHLASQNHRKANFTIIDPNGVETTFVGMRQFCRERCLRFSSFCDMVNGHVPSSQGWRLPKNCHVETGRTLPKTFNVKLKDPCGNIHGPITNLEEFCRIHKLRSSSIRHLLAGKCKSSLGWILCQ